MSQHVFSPDTDRQCSPLEWYQLASTREGFIFDPAQAHAIEQLESLYHQLLKFQAIRKKPFGKLFKKPVVPRGLYFWGGVGRGKSFLMDAFYSCVPFKRKQRMHFHHFMMEVHQELRTLKSKPDPLLEVAKRIAKKTRLMCFDEFHVSDIADAMILGRLLSALFDLGVIFVMTSNYEPDTLYPNGLQRNNFLPTIQLMKKWLEVHNLDGGKDYRLRQLETVDIYLTPHTADTQVQLEKTFTQMADGDNLPLEITLEGRTIQALRRSSGVIWFDFETLCGGPRSQVDYLLIAREYHTVILSNVPKLTAGHASEARRFTWLVDVFYDNRVKLIISAETEPEALYTEGIQATEFFRTASRLQEMQSTAYLSLGHLAFES